MDVAFSSISDTFSVLAFANGVGTEEALRTSTRDWNLVGSSLESGCALPFSVWRPREATGYRRLGDSVSPKECDQFDPPGVCEPDEPAVLMKDGPWLARPIGFEFIGQHLGLEREKLGLAPFGDRLFMWRPLPPPGFRCLGHVAVVGNDAPPSLEVVRCVTEGLLTAKEVYDSGIDPVRVGEPTSSGEKVLLRKALYPCVLLSIRVLKVISHSFLTKIVIHSSSGHGCGSSVGVSHYQPYVSFLL